MARHSRLTRMALRLPPLRRLHDAMRRVEAASEAMRAEQDRLARDLVRMSGELASAHAVSERALALASARPAAPQPAPASPMAAGEPGDEIDRLTRRELQGAALRCLPFLPGEIGLADEGIRMEGYAGAPEDLTANMAFFINGRRFDRVDYPVRDPELAGRFGEVRGMGYVVRAVMTSTWTS